MAVTRLMRKVKRKRVLAAQRKTKLKHLLFYPILKRSTPATGEERPAEPGQA